MTALYYSATSLPFRETPSRKILLDHPGINPNARTPQGCTAVHSVVHFVREKEPVKYYYENILVERINVMLKGRVGVDIQDSEGKAALHLAIEIAPDSFVKLLVESRAN